MESGDEETQGSDERVPPDDEVLADRYRLIGKVGSGGMAVVYVAEDSVLGRKVAVKRLHADSPNHAARRFLREAKLAAALSHPNLVTVFDAFPDAESLVIVMEYIAGPDLAEVLGPGPLEDRRAVSVLRDVAAALDHLHGRGIVHRDVKPSNILMAPDGRARLTDLGIARVLEDTSTTQTNMMLGSAPYMSPEQLAGEPVGPAADVYAFALTAFEVLSGERARTGIPAAITYQATVQPPPDIRDVRPSAPPAVAVALKRGLARDPRARFATCGDLVDELSEALRTGAAATPASPQAPTQLPSAEAVSPREAPAAAPPFRPPPTNREPPSRRSTHGRNTRALVLALAALLAGLVAVLVITSGNDDGGSGALSGERNAESETGREPGPGGRGGAAAGSPEAAVRTFYELGAEHDFEGAAALATSNLETQLGGPGGIPAAFETLESIEFTELRTASESSGTAEVELATVATHPTYTDTCRGSVSLIKESEAWLVDRLHIDCT